MKQGMKLGILLLVMASCGKKPITPQGEVRTTVVDKGDLVISVPLQGTFDALRRFELSPPRASSVEKMEVRAGAWVKRGQILARLRTRDAQLLIGAAEAQLEQAGARGDEAASEAARKDLEFAKSQYPDALILAPSSGFVVRIAAKEGESFVPGSASLITLGDRVVVRIKANQMDAAVLRPGQKAVIRAEAFPDEPVTTRVLSVAASGNKNDWESDKYVTFEVVLDFPTNAPLPIRLGMGADADVEVFRKNGVLRLPREFLIRDAATPPATPTDPYVYVGSTGPEGKKGVKIGDRDRTHVELVSGLAEGATVILPLKKIDSNAEWW